MEKERIDIFDCEKEISGREAAVAVIILRRFSGGTALYIARLPFSFATVVHLQRIIVSVLRCYSRI